MKSLVQNLPAVWLRRYGLRAALVATVVGWLLAAVWQATQFEIHPDEEGTPFLLADPRPGTGDWPGWRGPSRQGAVESEFIAPPVGSGGWVEHWRFPTPATTHSGVCIWADRVFVVIQEPQTSAVVLVCINRGSGVVEWRTPLARTTGVSATIATRSLSAVPTCDGERVFVPVITQGQCWLFAVQMDGRLAWRRAIGPGRVDGVPASSPVISGSLVIVSCDQAGMPLLPGKPCSYLAALHRQTGELVYRMARANGDSSGTPVVADIAGRPQLVVTGRHAVRSYDPTTGRELWFCRWKAARTEGSVAFDADHVYAASGDVDGEVVCISAEGEGDVTESHVVWRERRPGQAALSPLLVQGGLIVLTRDGLLTALNPATGKPLWQKRSLGDCSVPPLRIGTQGVCVITDEGQITLFNADRRGDVLWEHAPGHAISGMPAVSQGRLLLRTPQGVISLGGEARGSLVQQPQSTGKPL